MTKLLSLCAAVALLAAACGGGSSDSTTATPAATPRAAATAPAAASSPAARATAGQPGATVEVTGIVGTVNAGQSQINIQHLSGVAVRKISVDSRTSIRKAGGGALTLGEIRPSDRIIAEGTLNDRQDMLLATQITVEQVVPGAQPGG